MKLLNFYLIEDSSSENTMNLLQYLNTIYKSLNDSNFKINIILIEKNQSKNKEFINLMLDSNISSIPALTIENSNGKILQSISGIKGILEFLNSSLSSQSSPSSKEDLYEYMSSNLQNYREDEDSSENNSLTAKLNNVMKERGGDHDDTSQSPSYQIKDNDDKLIYENFVESNF